MIARILAWFSGIVFLAIFTSAAVSVGVGALEVPAAPTDIPVVDQTNTLTSEQKRQLAQQIADERKASGNQIAVLMIRSLEGDSIEGYSLKVARKWGIGTGENNNGVLLLVAKDDRKLRIEVGTGLEGALTDAQAGRIIRNEITPQFRNDKYYEGVRAGVTSIIAATNGEYVASGNAESQSWGDIPWEALFFIGLIGFSWLGAVLGRTKGWWAGGVIGGIAGVIVGFLMTSLLVGILSAVGLAIGGLFFDKAVSKNYRAHMKRGDSPSWWAGGGFLGGSGDSGGGDSGFGGFGGGGFGGGGSSGSW